MRAWRNYSKCIQNVFRMYSECIQNFYRNRAWRKNSECIQNVFRMYSICIQNVFRMYSECIQNFYRDRAWRNQNVFRMYSECIQKLSPTDFIECMCISCVRHSQSVERGEIRESPTYISHTVGRSTFVSAEFFLSAWKVFSLIGAELVPCEHIFC